jgi:dienelactone hydrolase
MAFRTCLRRWSGGSWPGIASPAGTRALASAAVLTSALALLAPPAASAAVERRDVDLKGPDGVVLKATYFSPGSPGPAVLLIHQCNMTRRAWDDFANALATAGFHVLSPDLRGFGDSGRKPEPQKWAGDLDLALRYLTTAKDVDQSRLAVGGASCGTVEAALLASRHRGIRALVLLSGGAGAGQRFIADTASLPVFGAAAERDDAAEPTRQAVEASRNPHSNLRVTEGREHGVAMFRSHPDLVALIVQWLHDQLAPAVR